MTHDAAATYSFTEAARRCDGSPDLIEALVGEGKLKAVQVGPFRQVTAASFAAWYGSDGGPSAQSSPSPAHAIHPLIQMARDRAAAAGRPHVERQGNSFAAHIQHRLDAEAAARKQHK